MQGSRRTLVLRTAAIALGALALMPAAGYADGLTPASPASPGTEDTQIAYVVMVVLATLIALAVIGGLIAAARGRAEGAADERAPRTRGTGRIQGRVGVGLGLLALAVFVFGIIVTESARKVDPTGANGLATAQLDLKPPPGEAKPLEIEVTGQQWLWRYEYPDGTFSYFEMVVPVDTAVVLKLESTDVLHSWWVPALTGMFEVAPGSDNKTWFKADEVGTYAGSSTQFSGDAYASMRAAVRVVEPAEYEAWLAQQAEGIQEAQESVARQVESGTGPGAGLG